MDNEIPHVVCLKKFKDSRGVLVPVESGREEIPFEIKRVFWIVSPKESRAGHAHTNCQQIVFVASGQFSASTKKKLPNGSWDVRDWILIGPNDGLYVPTYTWLTMRDFSEDCVIVVLSSEYYSDEEIIKDYEQFKKTDSGSGNSVQ